MASGMRRFTTGLKVVITGCFASHSSVLHWSRSLVRLISIKNYFLSVTLLLRPRSNVAAEAKIYSLKDHRVKSIPIACIPPDSVPSHEKR
ncbi:hypothetical protein AKJ16_DCAP19948 [Drosera capensis]